MYKHFFLGLNGNIKQANLESEFFQRLLFIEIEKNLQILNRITVGDEFKDPTYLKDVLDCLDFTYLTMIVHNRNITPYLSKINSLKPDDDAKQEENLEDYILYVITRLHALRNYENLKRISKVDLNTGLIMKRIKENLVQMKILLIRHKRKSFFERFIWKIKKLFMVSTL